MLFGLKGYHPTTISTCTYFFICVLGKKYVQELQLSYYQRKVGLLTSLVLFRPMENTNPRPMRSMVQIFLKHS